MFAASAFIKDRRKRRIALLALPFAAAGVVALGMFANMAIGKYALLGTHSIPQTGANQASSLGLLDSQPTPQPITSPTVTPTPTPTGAASCVHPEGWVPYVVAPTDSLFRLSVVYGVGVDDLQNGNCMANETVILPGNVIYVPFLPSLTPTLTSTATQLIPTNTAVPPQPAGNQQNQPSNKPASQPNATPVPPTQAPQVAPTSVPPTNPPPQPTAKPPEAKPPEKKPADPPKKDNPPTKGGGDKGGGGGKGGGKGGKGKG